MDLITRISRIARSSPPPRHRQPVGQATPAAVATPADIGPAPTAHTPDLPMGCGWFDSSHELQCGLHVTEHDSADRVANDLPLEVWIAWHLGSAPAGTFCASSAY